MIHNMFKPNSLGTQLQLIPTLLLLATNSEGETKERFILSSQIDVINIMKFTF